MWVLLHDQNLKELWVNMRTVVCIYPFTKVTVQGKTLYDIDLLTVGGTKLTVRETSWRDSMRKMGMRGL